MASQGPFLPTVAANVGTGTSWTNPNNILVGTDAASAVVTTASKDLLGTGFGFSIPLGSTILGIQVDARGQCPDGPPTINWYMYKAGSRVGTSKSGGFTGGGIITITKGGSSDLWGTTWTPTEVNDSTFGFALATANANQTNVFWYKITVTYSPPAVTGAFLLNFL